MSGTDSVVAIFNSEHGARVCVEQLTAVGIDRHQISRVAPASNGDAYAIGPAGGVEGFFETIGDWGMRPHQVGYYRRALRDGKSLVLVTMAPAQAYAALRVLKKTPAIEVNLHVTTDDACAVPAR